MIDQNYIRGTLLGTAVGDALGMPVEGLSHQNVRTYYKGIKEYRADDQRGDLDAGQWTDDTQFTFALVRALTRAEEAAGFPEVAAEEYVDLLPAARRWGETSRPAVERLSQGESWKETGMSAHPTNGAAMRAAPLGAWWALAGCSKEKAWEVVRPVFEVTHRHPASVAAAFGQAFAVCYALHRTPGTFRSEAFWQELTGVTAWVEGQLDGADQSNTDRLQKLTRHLGEFPLDLQDVCNGTGGYASESWPFAVAMFARNPTLAEATLLSAVNVGGDADTVGAMTGALLGALNGWSAFPAEWQDDLEEASRLTGEADAYYEALSRLSAVRQ